MKDILNALQIYHNESAKRHETNAAALVSEELTLWLDKSDYYYHRRNENTQSRKYCSGMECFFSPLHIHGSSSF